MDGGGRDALGDVLGDATNEDATNEDATNEDAGDEDASDDVDADAFADVLVDAPPAGEAFVLGELKAMPQALGAGAFTQGGRGGRVVEVTNDNTSGEGSLREAIEGLDGSPTIIIPTRGFFIDHSEQERNIRVGGGNYTIYGQYAPGDGLFLYGEEIEDRQVHSSGIYSGFRIRGGDSFAGTQEKTLRLAAFSNSFSDILIINMSLAWGDDETLAVGGSHRDGYSATNLTLQNTMLVDSTGGGKGFLIAGNSEISVITNVSVNNKERPIGMMSWGDTRGEYINNALYGFRRNPWQQTFGARFDIIGNILKSNDEWVGSTPIQTLARPANSDFPASDTAFTNIDNSLNGVIGPLATSGDAQNEEVSTPVFPTAARVLANHEGLEEFLFEYAGAFPRDAIDAKAIEDFRNGTGRVYSSQTDAGWGTLPTWDEGAEPDNSDGDYIYPTWELEHGLDPATSEFDVKPEFFVIDGVMYDNREYAGGVYDGFEYSGGTLTGERLYTWFEIFMCDRVRGFGYIQGE